MDCGAGEGDAAAAAEAPLDDSPRGRRLQTELLQELAGMCGATGEPADAIRWRAELAGLTAAEPQAPPPGEKHLDDVPPRQHPE